MRVFYISLFKGISVSYTHLDVYKRQGNIDAFTENVEKEVKIHVSIDSLTKDEQIEKLEKEISSFPQVKPVSYTHLRCSCCYSQ